MKHQNQEKVRQNLENMRQQIKQTHSPIMLRRQEPQMILNPYVRSSPWHGKAWITANGVTL